MVGYNRAALQAAIDASGPPELLFFWGHRPSKDGRITASCLSQWWPAPFVVDGRTYRTAEHWMMASKARLFGDEATAARILSAEDPRRAKALGRKATGFDADEWDRRKFDVVTQGGFEKFAQHPPLREFLLSTGQAVLVEASPVDRVWGIGLAADDPFADDPMRWRGENLLGFSLMEVRDRLRSAG